jgi:hypothetical protein
MILKFVQEKLLLKEKKIQGIILILFSVLMILFTFIKVPVISTFHSYTVGLFFGKSSVLVYGYLVFLGLSKFTSKITKGPR